MADGLHRRGALGAGLGLAALATGLRRAAADTPPALLPAPPDVPAWTHEMGAPLASPPYGLPAPSEGDVVRRLLRHTAQPGIGVSLTPLQDLHGIITPGGLHYERHHAGVPAIDPERHRLMVHGLVRQPLVFTMDDLMRMPAVSRIHFLECSGNSSQLWRGVPGPATVQDTHGMLSCSEWTGVRLADLLDQVGVQPQARWVLAEGADGAALTRSVPIEKAMDDAILAYAQNGERLRPEQGYPLRLLLPGYEGNTNIKWLRRLKLGTEPWMTREETAHYTDIMPGGVAGPFAAGGVARQFEFVMEAKSVVTSPSGGQALRGHGFHEIRGLAWSGRGAIRQVEVSTDAGASWRDAALQGPVLPICLTRFRLPWRWDGGPATLQSRATDDSGRVQPSHDALLAERGPAAYYHYNAVHAWRVAPSGEVTNAA